MKTKNKAVKRKISTVREVLCSQNIIMSDQEKSKEHMVSPDVDITKDAASKILAVELNKRLKPKENEQDPIPSDDDEDAYPELHLKKEDIERIKKAKLAEQNKGNS